MTGKKNLSRRDFLKFSGLVALGSAAAACAPTPAPTAAPAPAATAARSPAPPRGCRCRRP